MKKDIIFRGCTRPPMFMGVPYVPFFIAFGGCFMLAVYINLFLLLLLPPILFILRQIARQDEMIFRLWGSRLRMLTKVRNRGMYQDMWSFSPSQYRPLLADSVREAHPSFAVTKDDFDFSEH